MKRATINPTDRKCRLLGFAKNCSHSSSASGRQVPHNAKRYKNCRTQSNLMSLQNAERVRTRRQTAKQRANPFHFISFTLEAERSGNLQATKVERYSDQGRNEPFGQCLRISPIDQPECEHGGKS